MSSIFSTQRILVVENNPTMLSLFRQLLQALGAGSVIAMKSAEDAIIAMQPGNIDMVITDCRMEPLSGLDLVKWIRTDAASPNKAVPVIMASAYSDAEQVIAARNAGVDEFLVKPITVSELKKRMTAVIRAKREFVSAETYVGPSRRVRSHTAYSGEERRTPAPANESDASVEFEDLSF